MIMFSIVNVLTLRPPQVKEPERLLECQVRRSSGRKLSACFSYSDYVDIRDNNPAFGELVAYGGDFSMVTLAKGDLSRLCFAMHVSANYFSVLGVNPLCGRAFLPEEIDRHGSGFVAAPRRPRADRVNG